MKRIMIDIDKCTGCLNCSIACMQSHRKDEGNLYTLNLGDKSNESRNYIRQPAPGKYVPLFCRHCDDPECAMACMSGAIMKDKETGLMRYFDEKCASCFMCVMNCSYGMTRPGKSSKVIKCDFCAHDPLGPNCVRMCPNKSIYIAEVVAK
ncbi:MAG: nitrate reductase [Eubacteriaceae bacterium]|nr:nitrate reductase [Eubacteriaceae bacterium]